MKSQTQKVREKLLLQANRILKKFKPSEGKEVTNQEVQLALYQYSVSSEYRNEYQERQLEWLDDRLAELTEPQMSIIRAYFWEGKTLKEIGESIGITESGAWRRLEECFRVIREKR